MLGADRADWLVEVLAEYAQNSIDSSVEQTQFELRLAWTLKQADQKMVRVKCALFLVGRSDEVKVDRWPPVSETTNCWVVLTLLLIGGRAFNLLKRNVRVVLV